MNDIIAVAKKGGKNKELLAMRNVDKTVMTKVAKILSTIDLRRKHNWVISNIDIDIARNLELIGIKKY